MSKQAQSAVGMPLENFFPGLKEFTYYPTTMFSELLKLFSPTLNFGCNIGDKPVEDYVLDNVGSYGKQLNCVLDTLSVLVSTIDKGDLTPDEQHAILRFKDLAVQADAASRRFQGKSPRKQGEARMTDVDDWLAALLKLKKDNPAAYYRLVSHLAEGLAEASSREVPATAL